MITVRRIYHEFEIQCSEDELHVITLGEYTGHIRDTDRKNVSK